jgi:molybdopterin-guanine dinucleotide biosynthesis protein A
VTEYHTELIYILAGGQSRRFGENKALVAISGEPLLVRLHRQMRQGGLQVTVVAQSTEDYATTAIATISDETPHGGPLAGIIAALKNAQNQGASWCYISSCDILEWRPEWQKALSECSLASPESQAIIMEGTPFRPFPGLYRTDLVRTAVLAWENGHRSIHRWFESLGAGISRCPVAPMQQPRAFNTPEELAKLLD